PRPRPRGGCVAGGDRRPRVRNARRRRLRRRDQADQDRRPGPGRRRPGHGPGARMSGPVFTVALPDARDAAVVGGKGASLGELTRAGVAVPPGFVVTVGAFAAVMAANDPSGGLRAELSALDAANLTGISAAA